MKKPYSTESWGRFKTLMQKLTKRTAIIETRSQLNEDNIAELQPEVEELRTKVDGINDFTTGENLLRGTRDFVVGTIDSANIPGNACFDDGFYNATAFDYYKDAHGFTVAHKSQSGLSANSDKNLVASLIHNPPSKLTVAFEFMIDEIGDFDQEVITRLTPFTADKISKTTSYLSPWVMVRGLTKETAESGKWYQAIYHVSLDSDVAYFRVILSLVRNGSINFRKLGVYEGHINNPEWSASSFDVAQQREIEQVPLMIGNLNSEKLLVSGMNLDDIIDPGSYGCNSNNVAASLTNCPTKKAFKMDVSITTGYTSKTSNYIYRRQTIVEHEESATEYTRFKERKDSEWTSWRQTYTNTTVRPIEGGGTGGNTVETARKNLKISSVLGTNKVSSIAEDTRDFWKSQPNGIYSLNQYVLHGQPSRYGFLYNIVENNDISQIFIKKGQGNVLGLNNSIVGVRFVNSDNTVMPPFYEVFSQTYMPYTPGLYSGQSIQSKFNSEIGSDHIANWLSSRVSQGNFEGLHIGDWVDIACTDNVTRRYVIAAIDPYYQTGSDTDKMGHHLVMVPADGWTLSSSLDGSYCVNTNRIMWDTKSTNNGTSTETCPYMASSLHKWEIEVALKRFPQEWQDVMINRLSFMETRYSASATLSEPNGATWANLGKLWTPSVVEIYGRNFRISNQYSGLSDTHFPLFSSPSNIRKATGQKSIWLRDVQTTSSTNAIISDIRGVLITNPVNSTLGYFAYPCFLIG